MTERRIVTEGAERRVLVTGARGFVGKALTGVLGDLGWEVHGLASRGGEMGSASVWHVADLLEPGSAEEVVEAVQPAALVHLAWAPNRGIYQSLENFRWVEASLELLRAFAASGGRRVVFAGSCAEYVWGSPEPLGESAPLASGNPYAAAKTSLGRLFLDYCRFAELSGAWARLFFLFGPGEAESRLVASVTASLLLGEPAACSHGEQVRDYLYVGEAAEALAALLASEVEGAVNVASGEGVRIRDLVADVARRLQAEELVELGAVPAPADEAPIVVAAIDRLREEVGWSPRRALGEGIDETIAWWTRRLTH